MQTTRLFGALTGAAPSEVDGREARNGLLHVAALSLGKTADALIDPKLVLAWLTTALGAPAAVTGALVPVREAGALLPQIALARRVAAARLRKTFWAAGAIVQGAAALGIALAALTLSGGAAGWTILALVAVLAVARAAGSVSHKDALARTVAKGRRGAVSGAAGVVGAAAAFAFGGLMASGLLPLTVSTLAAAVAVGGAAFLMAGLVFLALDEPAGTPEGATARTPFARVLAPLGRDAQLRRFVAARAALAVTALAPPYLVLLSAAEGQGALDRLGPLVIASAAASILSAWVWGRLSDRSSRQTLMAGGAMGAAVFLAAGSAGLATGGLGGVAGGAAAVFAAQIAYEGVRAGRKLHLTDMAAERDRAAYTALSNTVIGVALLAGGLFGVMADLAGPAAVLLAFAGLSALGAVLAAGLAEVQQTG